MLTQAGTADFTVGSVVYWTNDQLQGVLDRHRKDVRYQALEAHATLGSGGSATYKEYTSGMGCWEDGPTLQTSNYESAGTAYGFEARRGVVTFDNDTGGSVILITGAVYDLHRAAAEVWRAKAGYYAGAYDVSTDNHTLKRSQLLVQCTAQALRFGMLGPSWEMGTGSAGLGPILAERGDM